MRRLRRSPAFVILRTKKFADSVVLQAYGYECREQMRARGGIARALRDGLRAMNAIVGVDATLARRSCVSMPPGEEVYRPPPERRRAAAKLRLPIVPAIKYRSTYYSS